MRQNTAFTLRSAARYLACSLGGALVGCGSSQWDDVEIIDETTAGATAVVQETIDAFASFAAASPFDRVNVNTIAVVDATGRFEAVDPNLVGGAYIPHRRRIEVSVDAPTRLTVVHELCHAIDLTHGLTAQVPLMRDPDIQQRMREERPFQVRRTDREVFALFCDRGPSPPSGLALRLICGSDPWQQAHLDVQRVAFGLEPSPVGAESMLGPLVEIRAPADASARVEVLAPYRDGVLARWESRDESPWLCDAQTGEPLRQVAGPRLPGLNHLQVYGPAIGYVSFRDRDRIEVTPDGITAPTPVLPDAHYPVLLDDLVLAIESPETWIAQRVSTGEITRGPLPQGEGLQPGALPRLERVHHRAKLSVGDGFFWMDGEWLAVEDASVHQSKRYIELPDGRSAWLNQSSGAERLLAQDGTILYDPAMCSAPLQARWQTDGSTWISVRGPSFSVLLAD